MAPIEKKSVWSLQFESADEAQRAAADSAKLFYFIAAMQTAASLVLGSLMLVDAVAFAALGAWLHVANSRIAATLLLVLAGFSVVTTLMNQFGAGQGGGKNIFVAVIVAWAAVRAAIATYRLPGLLKQQVAPSGTPGPAGQ